MLGDVKAWFSKCVVRLQLKSGLVRTQTACNSNCMLSIARTCAWTGYKERTLTWLATRRMTAQQSELAALYGICQSKVPRASIIKPSASLTYCWDWLNAWVLLAISLLQHWIAVSESKGSISNYKLTMVNDMMNKRQRLRPRKRSSAAAKHLPYLWRAVSWL